MMKASAISLFTLMSMTSACCAPVLTFCGSPWNRNLGERICIGDLNGDGVVDAVVSSPYADAPGRPWAGIVYVIWGGTHLEEALSDPHDWKKASMSIMGETGYSSLGIATVTGDFNGDGISDLAISAPYAGRSWTGVVHVVFGSERLGAMQWDLADRQSDLTFSSALPHVRLGSVMGAGDVDGDGRDDLAISAPGFVIQPGHEGTVLVFLGVSMQGKSEWDVDTMPADATYYALRSAEIKILAFADTNGDGRDTLVIAAPSESNQGGQETGSLVGVDYDPGWPVVDLQTTPAAWRVYGNSQSEGFGESVIPWDADADGAEELIVGAPRASQPTMLCGAVFLVKPIQLLPWSMNLWTGPAYSLSGTSIAVGDLDGDGLDEVLVGSPEDDDEVRKRWIFKGKSDVGKVYLLRRTDAASLDVWHDSTPFEAETLLIGPERYSCLGRMVAMGDLNGDGLNDIIVGAPRSSPMGRRDAGCVTIVLGERQP